MCCVLCTIIMFSLCPFIHPTWIAMLAFQQAAPKWSEEYQHRKEFDVIGDIWEAKRHSRLKWQPTALAIGRVGCLGTAVVSSYDGNERLLLLVNRHNVGAKMMLLLVNHGIIRLNYCRWLLIPRGSNPFCSFTLSFIALPDKHSRRQTFRRPYRNALERELACHLRRKHFGVRKQTDMWYKNDTRWQNYFKACFDEHNNRNDTHVKSNCIVVRKSHI